MHLSGAYIKPPESKENKPLNEIEKLVAQLPSAKENFDWRYFPTELRPKIIVRRVGKKPEANKEIDINTRLEQLEKIEEKTNLAQDVTIKVEVEDEEAEEEEVEYQDEEDEEMDDGTDYANNYFDNGEAYDDEDDNLDDGPIY